jgi:putative membrane protein
MHMMGWSEGGTGGTVWIFVGLFWLVLVAAIIWLVVRLLPSKGHSDPKGFTSPPVASPPGAFEILDRRFAQGEIDLQTYQAHRAALIAARGGPQ